MALLKCSDCGNDVSIDAKSCPNCGTVKPFKNQVLTADESKKYSYGQIRGFQKGGGTIKMGKTAKIIMISIGIGILFLILKPAKPLTPEEQQAALEKSAGYYCEAIVNKNLKDPDSVEKTGSTTIQNDDGTFRTLYGFRAKNSFGGYVQSSYICELKRTGDNFEILSIHEAK